MAGNRRCAKGRFALRATTVILGFLVAISSSKAQAKTATLTSVGAKVPGPPTFNKDVAPIVFARCSQCHRPEESGPFNLLTYEDVKKHADQIVEVTAKRYMPPWLPEPGYGEFANSRRLSAAEIAVFRDWVAGGAVEGRAEDLPPTPVWTDGWQLGKPDLVLKAPAPFHLPAEGKDVYRNLIVPTGLTNRHFVRAMEFRPGNRKVVHHAFVKVDPTRQSRRLDAADAEPGFSGMDLPESVVMPDGQFLGWQPGRLPVESPTGLAWTLEAGSDLVMQLHLRLSGKPELVQPDVGLYFTDLPPVEKCAKFALASLVIDIPAGASDHVITDDFTLPVDLQVLAVLPHAHYLCREMQGFATLPDGTKKWLLWIKHWDFNWQGDYRYEQPVFLPKGTTLSMRYTYDNSTSNIANPNHPPRRVTYGPQSTDEMGELWFQVLPGGERNRRLLMEKHGEKMLKNMEARHRHDLALDPRNPVANRKLGFALLAEQRPMEAIPFLQAAVEISPQEDEAHYLLGLAYRVSGRTDEARAEFERTLQLDARHFKAHGNLGVMFAERGALDQAEEHLRAALAINPEDALAREWLQQVVKAKAERGAGQSSGRSSRPSR